MKTKVWNIFATIVFAGSLYAGSKGNETIIVRGPAKYKPNPLDRPYWEIPEFQYEMMPWPFDPPVTKIGDQNK